MVLLKNENIPFDKNISIGSMIEVPSALLTVDQILSVSDFISIGTNDLNQYLTASDREILSVADYLDFGKTILLSYIQRSIESANKLNQECTICGELAGDPDYIKNLIRIGLTHFSVSPRQIPYVKNMIYSYPRNA